MRLLIQQYGRVILITVIFILFFLWIPVLTKRLGQSSNMQSNEQKENVTTDTVFYVDGVKYYTEKGMSWDEWVVSDYNRDENGARIFNVWKDPCNNNYKVGVGTTTEISKPRS